MDLVEKVARALIERQIRVNRQWDTERADLEETLPRAIDYAWRDREADARIAIEAMREPSDDFLTFIAHAHDLRPQDWAEIIDAALNPQISP